MYGYALPYPEPPTLSDQYGLPGFDFSFKLFQPRPGSTADLYSDSLNFYPSS